MSKNKISSNNLILIEGFDMVGKSTYVDKQIPPFFTLYECRHKLTDETVGRHNSWTIGYGIIDMLEQLFKDSGNSTLMNLNLVINRGVFSSYVYARLYGNTKLNTKILDFYRENDFFKDDITHIYVKHHNIETAQFIYEASQKRDKIVDTEISKQFDTFKSFEDYWRMYSLAELLFKEAYDYVGVKPHIIETMDNMTWNEVED